MRIARFSHSVSVMAVAVLSMISVNMALPVRAADPLKVVVTFSILGDLVENVGGDLVSIQTLVGADGDAHAFEPTATEAQSVADAQVIIENGLEFETWLDNLVSGADSKAVRVVVSEGIEPLEGEEHEDGEHEESTATADSTTEADDEEDHEHEHEEDPHIWQSVKNAVIVVRNIEKGLSAADPTNAATYKRNADAYVAELNALDAEIRESVESIPADQRKLVTSHDALGYYAAEYGFTVVGTVIPSSNTEAETTSAELATLIDTIRSSGVKAVFAENISNTALIQQVVDETGVKFAPELYTDALGQPGTDGDTYIRMMQHNTRVIVENLR